MPNGWPSLEIKYEDTITVFLSRLNGKIASNIPKLLEALGKRVRYRFKKNIEQGQDGRGVRFKPLKHRRPKGHNPSMRPLYDSGALFRAIDYRIVSSDTVEIGENTRYGIFQNRGTRRIPKRPFISINDGPNGDISESELFSFAQYQFYESEYYQGNGPGEI